MIDDTHQAVLGNLGSAYSRIGAPEKARACWERLLELDPGNPYALHNLAGLSGILLPSRLPQR
jgi:Flp pilus assembly protein TadD